MKKIAAVILAAGFAITAACGGSSWSEDDKKELSQALFAAEMLGLFTEAQADCVGDFFMSHYSNMDEVSNAPESDADKLAKACGIDFEQLEEDWSF